MGLLGGVTPPPSGNLLLNPGFEEGAVSWTSDHADTVESGTNARTGSRFAGLNGWGQATSYSLDQAFEDSSLSTYFFLDDTAVTTS